MGRGLSLSLLFAGTSEFAVPSLQALAEAGYRVSLVLTRPDARAGRGLKHRPPPVRLAAERLGLPVRAPQRLEDPAEMAALAALAPEVMVVASYGRLLRPAVLALPRRGCLNVHASLLPAWRGASPVAHALLAGEPTTGVTIMRMDAGLDTGPILAQDRCAIGENEDCGSLTTRLAALGARLLVEVLPGWLAGSVAERPQEAEQATWAPALRKEDAEIEWMLPAEEVRRRVRAFTPAPGAFTWRGTRRLLVRRARALPAGEPLPPLPPGRIGAAYAGQGVPVRCAGETGLLLERVQPEGRPEMEAEAAARGGHLPAGECLGRPAPG